MSEEISLQQKFETIEKYHNDTGFLNFLSAEAGKGVSNVDYDIELAVLFLYIINGREEEDKIKGDDRNIAVEALYYAMGLYEADKQAKKEAVQKMMAEEDAQTIQGRLNAMKENMPSLNELGDAAKAKAEEMKKNLEQGKEELKAQAAAAKQKLSSLIPGFSGGKRRSKKNKSKKNKSKKSKKSRK